MSEADEEVAGSARARRLREEIARLRRSTGAGDDRTSPRPVSPREFTDAAARRTTWTANRPDVSVRDAETEGGDEGSTDRPD